MLLMNALTAESIAHSSGICAVTPWPLAVSLSLTQGNDSLANRTKWIWVSGIGCMAALVYSFFRMQKGISAVVAGSSDSLAATLGQMKGSIGFQWGWGVLLLGTILLIAAGATGDDYE
jgi:hypothetical protein